MSGIIKNLSDQTVKGRVMQRSALGIYPTGTIYIPNAVLDGETITIGSDVYEFDTNASVVAGNILVDVSGGATGADAIAALVTAIAASGTEAFSTSTQGANTLFIHGPLPEDKSFVLSETMADVANVVSGGIAGGREPHLGDQPVKVTPTATDVAAGVLRVKFARGADDLHVLSAIVQVLNASNIAIGWNGAVDGNLTDIITLTNEGAVDWAADQTVLIQPVRGPSASE